MFRAQSMPEVLFRALVGDLLNGRPIRHAGELAIEGNDVSIRGQSPVTREVQARDKCARLHLALSVYVGHLAHDQEPALDLHEISFLAQPSEIRITIE